MAQNNMKYTAHFWRKTRKYGTEEYDILGNKMLNIPQKNIIYSAEKIYNMVRKKKESENFLGTPWQHATDPWASQDHTYITQ